MLATYAEWVLPSSINTPHCPPLPSELLSRIFRYYLQTSTPYNPEETRSLGQICLPELLTNFFSFLNLGTVQHRPSVDQGPFAHS